MEWIIKIIGIAALIVAGFLAGNFKVTALKAKGEILEEIVTLLNCIKNNFLYRQSNVIAALNDADSIGYKHLDIRFDSLNCTEYKSELTKRITKSKNIPVLLNKNQDDKFKESLLLIGTGTLTEECDRLNFYINYFEKEHKLAVEFERCNKKLYYTMSLYISIVLAVILM